MPKGITILCTVTSNSEHCKYSDYATIALSPSKIQQLFAHRKSVVDLTAKNSQIYCLKIWDYSVNWIANADNDEHLTDEEEDRLDKLMVDSDEYVVVGETMGDLPGMRSECDLLVVTDTDFRWECYAKHTDIRHETLTFCFSNFEQYLQPGEVKNGGVEGQETVGNPE